MRLHVFLPEGVDDPARPSGGNRYDRRVCAGFAGTGWDVREYAVPGNWPRPGDPVALDGALAGVPNDGLVLVDGLIGCATPDVMVPAARRLPIAVLVHLPLASETGLSPDEAAELDAREGAVLRAVAATVATSEGAAATLIERHGLDPGRVRVAPPGADPAPPAVGSVHGSRLTCVASLTPRKGQDVLVEALARIADLAFTCDCVGGPVAGPYAGRLRELAAGYRLDDRFRLAGVRTGAALSATYAATDLLVLPSRAETYGMVVTEALARGVPVLATRVDGVPEALGTAPDGSTPGLLVPPGDALALAAALRRWLDSPDLREELRRSAALRRAELPGWEVTADLLVAAFREVAR